MTRQVKAHANGKPQAQPDRKERLTSQVPVELIEKVRDIVYFTPGETLARFVEEAVRLHVERTEKKRGEPYPSRRGATLKTGRPVGS